MVILAALALLAFALWLRLRPTRRGGRGVDAWFYIAYAEALRRQRRLPARLDNFLLDIEEQWYPPVFAALLACLPQALRLRVKDWVAPVTDVAHMALAMVVVAALGASPSGIVLAGAVYAVVPALVAEFSTLNSRCLASVMLTVALLAAAAQIADPGWTSVALTALAGALVVLTHKMATQLFVPLVVALSVVHGRVDLALAGGLGFVLAWALSGGTYGGMLWAHIAILRFWRTHLGNLGAHQVYDSPLYAGERRPDTARMRRFFEPGIRGIWLLARNIVAGNPVVLALPWLLVAAPPTALGRTLAVWLVTTYVLVVATTFVPALRFLGEGTKYAKFAAFPEAVLAGLAATHGPAAGVVLLGVALSAGVLWRLRHVPRFEVLDQEVARVVDFVRADPRPRVATIPCHYCDVLACLADKQVLWGAHSAGYEKLEEWFPVIRTPVEQVLDKYSIDLLLVDRHYVDPAHLRLGPGFRPLLDQERLLLIERVP